MTFLKTFATFGAAALLAVSGAACAQDLIVVGGGNIEIVDGSSFTSRFNHTDFGIVQVDGGNFRERIFIMSNLDESPAVQITGPITVTGPNAADFTVDSAQVEIYHKVYHSFKITFNPSGEGTRNATITIPNSTPGDKGSYSFAVKGEGDEVYVNTNIDARLQVLQVPKLKENSKTGLTGLSWSVDVYNNGLANLSGGKVMFFLSDDEFLSVDDLLLSEQLLKPIAGAKQTNNGLKYKKKKAKLKANVPVKSGYLVAVVLPEPAILFEEAVTNNVMVMPFGIEQPI